jgi:hypothetical protein
MLAIVALVPAASPSTRILEPRLDSRGSFTMAEHKFKIGQLVYFHPRKGPGSPLFVPQGPYKILQRLTAANGQFQYAQMPRTSASQEKAS